MRFDKGHGVVMPQAIWRCEINFVVMICLGHRKQFSDHFLDGDNPALRRRLRERRGFHFDVSRDRTNSAKLERAKVSLKQKVEVMGRNTEMMM